MAPPAINNGDGTITVSGRWTAWAAIVLALVAGGSTGYFGIVKGGFAQADPAWTEQRKVNLDVQRRLMKLGGPNDPLMPRLQKVENRVEQLRDVLYEIRADVRVIKASLPRQSGGSR